MSLRFAWLAGGWLGVAAAFGACSGPFAGGQTGSPSGDGHAPLLKCDTDADCEAYPEAYRCADAGYCVDRNGDPVRASRKDDAGLPLADAKDGGTGGTSAPGDPNAGAGGAGDAAGEGGAGGAGGSFEPVDVPPAQPPKHCPATIPEPEAACDPQTDAACTLGGFACSCQCQCVSSQSGDPPDCFQPCNWRCQYDALDTLLTSPEVAIDVACDAANPENDKMTASATITYAAPADGPPLTIDAGSGMYLEFEGIGNCTLDGVPSPATAGPVAPGETLTVTHVNGPSGCLGGGRIGYFCPTFCNAGARVGFTLKVSGGGAATTQYRSWFLGDGPRGVPYVAHCTP